MGTKSQNIHSSYQQPTPAPKPRLIATPTSYPPNGTPSIRSARPLRTGWRKKKFTIDDLWEAAETCRVARVMRPYLEAILM